jgi:hypothetical protein
MAAVPAAPGFNPQQTYIAIFAPYRDGPDGRHPQRLSAERRRPCGITEQKGRPCGLPFFMATGKSA